MECQLACIRYDVLIIRMLGLDDIPKRDAT